MSFLNISCSIAPNNDYIKFGAQTTISELPFDSTFSAKGDIATLKNSIVLQDSILNVVSGTAATSPTYSTVTLGLNVADKTYKGKLQYSTASFSLNSKPLSKLDSKIYYSFISKKNTSDIVQYTYGGKTEESELFGYRKQYTGVDLVYKLPFKTKVLGGFEYYQSY
ncbi:MAG: hypothetical protein HY843_01120 [Bdellovibrio sp.]|nr:hypothetical protein [Bdellovibrio sp.]